MTTEDKRYDMNFPEIVRNKCPCDVCDHFMLCKTEELACRSFAKFVVDNYYYVNSFRNPSKETFNKVFNTIDEDLLRKFVRGEKDEDIPEDNKGE